MSGPAVPSTGTRRIGTTTLSERFKLISATFTLLGALAFALGSQYWSINSDDPQVVQAV
jgi:hypothetical protein